MEIAQRLLKQATHLNTHATLKSIMILTAIISYMKLYHKWKNTGAQKRKQPAKTASAAVMACMGKGPRFARQICQMVPYIYIQQHHWLPDHKRYSQLESGSLLDNEAVIAGVWRHLAEQKPGKVSGHYWEQKPGKVSGHYWIVRPSANIITFIRLHLSTSWNMLMKNFFPSYVQAPTALASKAFWKVALNDGYGSLDTVMLNHKRGCMLMDMSMTM